MLTKYHAEKEICWYHWEVVDAACCDCVAKNDDAGPADKNSTKQARRTFYKPAPEEAKLGDVLPVSEEEWVKLAAVLSPDPTEVAAASVADSPSKSAAQPNGETKALGSETTAPSLAERVQRSLK